MVKGWRAGCCLGMQMMLGELRLGLPSPELPMLLVLVPIPMAWPTWEWFSMFLEFMGNVPLWKPPFYLDWLCNNDPKRHEASNLLGDGGVWRDMVGTPVVGVI